MTRFQLECPNMFYIGGGTLIPWALIPAAAICNVSPFELTRRNLISVVIGLVAIVAMFLIYHLSRE